MATHRQLAPPMPAAGIDEYTGLMLEDLVVSGRTFAFDERVISACLLAIAACGGSAPQAHKALTARGFEPLPHRETMSNWRLAMPNRYRALWLRHQHEIEGALVQEVSELVISATRAANLAVQKTYEALESGALDGDAEKLGRAARDAATAMGIANQNHLLLTDRPTHITETRSADDIIRSLDARGFVESTAVDIDEP